MSGAAARDPALALVLSGGVALGAFHAGALVAMGEAGLEPGWLAGSSIGAVVAAIHAGSPPGERAARLAAFWRRAAAPDLRAFLPVPPQAAQLWSVATAQVAGPPSLYAPNLPGATLLPLGSPGRSGRFSLEPLRRTLGELVDFGRLGSGEVRLTVVATDLASGDPVVFDTARGGVTMDHLLASSGFVPDFAPTCVDGRWLGDGGLSHNAPVATVLEDGAGGDLACVVLDLFEPPGIPPDSLARAQERRYDLLFGNQTRLALEAARREGELRAAISLLAKSLPPGAGADPATRELLALGRARRADLLRLAYADPADDVGMTSYDFGGAALSRRWEAGARAVRDGLVPWLAGVRAAPTLPGTTLEERRVSAAALA